MTRLPRFVATRDDDEIDRLLRRYFGLAPTGGRFTGAHFEDLGVAWDETAYTDVVTPTDIVAVSCLSVDIPAAASILMLDRDAGEISSLLARIPCDLDLWDAPIALLERGAAAHDLWNLLRTYPGMGPTKVSKLMARKRARLLPIYDSVVRDQLGLTSSVGYWATIRQVMREEANGTQLHTWIATARRRVGLSDNVTDLRAFDAAVWLAGSEDNRRARDGSTDRPDATSN